MKLCGVRTARWLWVALGCAALSGCQLGLDVVNPGVWSALGVDPAVFQGPPGVVLVAFNNTTADPATFFAFSAPNADDILSGSRSFSIFVVADEVRNEVVQCPIELIAPGQLDASGLTTLAATVAPADGNAVDVNYAGGALQRGVSFVCGDVIEIRLSLTADGYEINVFIIPGQ